MTNITLAQWAERERRRRARNWWLLTCAVIVIAGIVGYLWRM